MRVLVIGGTGYVGCAVTRALAKRSIDVVSLSRSGQAFAGSGVRGDVRMADLGMSQADAEKLRASLTHVVSCFGSVDWNSGPRIARELHEHGTRNALDFAKSCPSLERFVHLSSVLALGRAPGTITDELELGQSFRNWYEYGKFLAEREVRANESLPWRVVRVGGVIGPGLDVPPDTNHGLLSVIPFLLQGYPVHITERGRFPCYASDAETAGEVIARAALDSGSGDVWTWFDSSRPTLLDVLVAICSAWGVVPRIAAMPFLQPLMRVSARRVGVPPELLAYTDPWVDISSDVLDRLPPDLPSCPDGYVEATGQVLRRSSLTLSVAA